MSITKIRAAIVCTLRTFTIEPTVFLFILADSLVRGAELQANLLIWKICRQEIGFNETVCEHLNEDGYDDFQIQVQKKVNHFQMVSSWLSSVPALVFSLFAGALSDDLGRKPLLILPIFGSLVTAVVDIINYLFIDYLPVEFFYLEQINSLFGGIGVYYLGFYSFGASITNFEERASRLARFDGVEQLGMLIGLFLSPVLFNAFGYLCCFITKAVIIATSLAILITVEEPLKKKKNYRQYISRSTCLKTCYSFLQTYVIVPFKQTLQTVFKKRPRNLRFLVLLQLLIYGLYWFVLPQAEMMYLYMRKVLDGFDGTDNAFYVGYIRSLGMISLLVIMPIISGKLHIHEALIVTFITFTNFLGVFFAAFAHRLWQFYACETLTMMRMCQYSLARSLFTKCVASDEVGKIFSAIALLVALVPIGSNPAFRQLYESTLDTVPSAFILLAASVILITSLLNWFVFSKRRNMLVDRFGTEIGTTQTNLDDVTLIDQHELHL